MRNYSSITRNPWTFVPTLYFFEGLPYVLINTVSVILYKRMGVDNASIAFWTSWLYLPVVKKMFWAPSVEMAAKKRSLILFMQLAMGLSLLFAAYSLTTVNFFLLSMLAFAAGAFISATYDMATDGFYMLALTEKDQALFAGLRTSFYRLAMIFGSGVLVYLAGRIEVSTGNIPVSWMLTLSLAAAIFFVSLIFHRFTLPYPPSDRRNTQAGTSQPLSMRELT